MTKPICRDSQIELLSLYLGLNEDEDEDEDEETEASLPEVVLVQGVAGTGKTVTLQWLLASSQPFTSHAFVDCVECYQPRLVFQSVLAQLAGPKPRDTLR